MELELGKETGRNPELSMEKNLREPRRRGGRRSRGGLKSSRVARLENEKVVHGEVLGVW